MVDGWDMGTVQYVLEQNLQQGPGAELRVEHLKLETETPLALSPITLALLCLWCCARPRTASSEDFYLILLVGLASVRSRHIYDEAASLPYLHKNFDRHVITDENR